MIKDSRDIENNSKFGEVDEDILRSVIQSLAQRLRFSMHDGNDKEILIRLKQAVDNLYNAKFGKIDSGGKND